MYGAAGLTGAAGAGGAAVAGAGGIAERGAAGAPFTEGAGATIAGKAAGATCGSGAAGAGPRTAAAASAAPEYVSWGTWDVTGGGVATGVEAAAWTGARIESKSSSLGSRNWITKVPARRS
jgi:hypothetical protein